jgi:hypothetical protein
MCFGLNVSPPLPRKNAATGIAMGFDHSPSTNGMRLQLCRGGIRGLTDAVEEARDGLIRSMRTGPQGQSLTS